MKSKDFDIVKPYVYWIKNLKTGIKYIGSRYGNIKLNLTPNQDLGIVYFSSGKLEEQFKKFPDQFKIKLIATFSTPQEATNYETLLTKQIYKKKRYANAASYPAVIQTAEVRKKISIALTGKKLSIETKKRLSLYMKNAIKSGERKVWNKGKKTGNLSKEHRKKISKANKGHVVKEETRLKLAQSNKGQGLGLKRPSWIGEKISKSNKGKRLGFKHSEESKNKMSNSLKGKGLGLKRPSWIGEKISKALTGKKLSEAHRKSLSEAHKGQGLGRKTSEEIKRKISMANKGKKHSIETRKKMSEAVKGRKHSEESKKKMSKAQKGRNVSLETRKKISESNKRTKALKRKIFLNADSRPTKLG